MRVKSSQIILSALALLLTVGCSSISSTPRLREYWPTDGWLTADPVDFDLDAEALDKATATITKDLPFLDTLLIIRNGYIVHESYYNGFDRTTLHDIRSVTKSWTSALVGLARSQGKLIQLEAPLPELLPMYFTNGRNSDKSQITLGDLLAMRSGIDFDDEKLITGGYGGTELLENDLTEFALSFPMAHKPGTAWNYSTLDSQLISAVFEHVMGESLESFASKHLFSQLGIKEYEWLEDGTGTTIGGGNLFMTPRDMAKLGLLYLHKGQWEDKQIVPSDWVTLSTSPQNSNAYFKPSDQTEFIEWYGYHWWTWKADWFYGYNAIHAQGFAGQQVLVFPELELIIVTTAQEEDVSPEIGEAQEEGIFRFIHDSILPTLTEIDVNSK